MINYLRLNAFLKFVQLLATYFSQLSNTLWEWKKISACLSYLRIQQVQGRRGGKQNPGRSEFPSLFEINYCVVMEVKEVKDRNSQQGNLHMTRFHSLIQF